MFIAEVLAFMNSRGIQPSGPSFFRFNAVDTDGEMDMEFGYFTEKLHPGAGPIRSGILPSGSYLSATWIGAYTHLEEVQRLMSAWVDANSLRVDRDVNESGTIYGCRIEIHHVSPPIEPEPEKWRTEIAMLLKPGAADQ